MPAVSLLDVIISDLKTRPQGEITRIRDEAREIVYSGATTIKALGQESQFSREDAAQILKACNDRLNPALPPDSDPTGPNFADSTASPHHAMRFDRLGYLCGA